MVRGAMAVTAAVLIVAVFARVHCDDRYYDRYDDGDSATSYGGSRANTYGAYGNSYTYDTDSVSSARYPDYRTDDATYNTYRGRAHNHGRYGYSSGTPYYGDTKTGYVNYRTRYNNEYDGAATPYGNTRYNAYNSRTPTNYGDGTGTPYDHTRTYTNYRARTNYGDGTATPYDDTRTNAYGNYRTRQTYATDDYTTPYEDRTNNNYYGNRYTYDSSATPYTYYRNRYTDYDKTYGSRPNNYGTYGNSPMTYEDRSNYNGNYRATDADGYATAGSRNHGYTNQGNYQTDEFDGTYGTRAYNHAYHDHRTRR